ncbi:hypothetical protein ANN_26678 [Periplaneta americana]|uniref:Uncharacterized protein n=1 Tax=Periplaneta americana TaxID=6978 RepID=A0ABQ8RYS3_PERAM|nr:hypothetical protein ANN_26678 [Periplaneta americana]
MVMSTDTTWCNEQENSHIAQYIDTQNNSVVRVHGQQIVGRIFLAGCVNAERCLQLVKDVLEQYIGDMVVAGIRRV